MERTAKNKKTKQLVAMMVLFSLVACLGIAAFLGFQFFREWQALQTLNAEKAALSAKLDDVQSKNDAIKQELEDSTADNWVARMAREMLGWVMPGEIKIVDKNK